MSGFGETVRKPVPMPRPLMVAQAGHGETGDHEGKKDPPMRFPHDDGSPADRGYTEGTRLQEAWRREVPNREMRFPGWSGAHRKDSAILDKGDSSGSPRIHEPAPREENTT